MSVCVSPAALQPCHIKTLAAESGSRGRITKNCCRDPLCFNCGGESRFSPPYGSGQFGVIYFAENFETCFTEKYVRDKLISNIALQLLAEEAANDIYVSVCLQKPLKLLDLTRGNFLPLHIPSDTLRGKNWRGAQHIAFLAHSHQEKFDGILYESRFTADKNLILFDRAKENIKACKPVPVLNSAEFPELADKYLLEASCF